MLKCWTDVTHVDEYIFGWELSWLSLHNDADDNDEEEEEDDEDEKCWTDVTHVDEYIF